MINLRPDENGKVTKDETPKPGMSYSYFKTPSTSSGIASASQPVTVGQQYTTGDFPQYTVPTPLYTGGYTCASCKMWVMNGSTHYCTYNYLNTPPTTQYHYHTYMPQDLTPLLQKMEELLKEMKAIKKELAKAK